MSSNWIWIAFLLFITPFGLVTLFGAPYVPSRRGQLVPFLKKLGAKKGQRLVDLGSGDGVVVKHAAQQLGLETLGIELNPFLVFFSRLRIVRLGKRARIQYGDMWTTRLPEDVDFIYIFALPKYMDRLEKKIEKEIKKNVVVITYSFEFTKRKPFSSMNGFHAYRFDRLPKRSAKI